MHAVLRDKPASVLTERDLAIGTRIRRTGTRMLGQQCRTPRKRLVIPHPSASPHSRAPPRQGPRLPSPLAVASDARRPAARWPRLSDAGAAEVVHAVIRLHVLRYRIPRGLLRLPRRLAIDVLMNKHRRRRLPMQPRACAFLAIPLSYLRRERYSNYASERREAPGAGDARRGQRLRCLCASLLFS